jgi:tRNA(Ile)-lysidine synthase
MNQYLSQFTQNLLELYPFKQSAKFAIAVSGGADSLALLLLAKEWAHLKGHQLIALTVDHQLRKESADEALYVANLCKDLSIEHCILDWRHNGVSANIQEQAREARYLLLTNYCNKNDIINLLTAHHADDRLENFFIRLSRGSGLIGLSEHNISFHNNVQILRPIFNFTKEDCYRILKLQNINHVEDPSNNSDKYLRSEIREKLPNFLELKNIDAKLFKDRILSSIDNLSRASKTIEQAFLNCLTHSTTIFPEGYVRINLENFEKYMEEERLLCLSHLLTLISGTNFTPRYYSVKNLYLGLLKENKNKATLHGCVISKTKNELLIYKELGKKKSQPTLLKKDTIWDNRFLCKLNKNFPQDLYIDYASEADLKILKMMDIPSKSTLKLPKPVIFTLPLIKSIEKPLAIPHINYYTAEGHQLRLHELLSIKFKPSFLSRLTHYVF